MEKLGWKILAIIFIVLFVIENIFIGWGIYLNSQDEKQIKECYYEICNGYYDAKLIDGICYCYNQDVLGNVQVANYTWMKK